jgi:zinc transporter ZupT
MYHLLESAYTIGAVTIVLSTLGALICFYCIQKWYNTQTHTLVLIASGVLSVSALSVITESIHTAPSTLFALMATIAGFLLATLLSISIPESHHHHDTTCTHSGAQKSTKLIIGDAIHTIGDGILIGSVAVSAGGPALLITTALGICLHETLNELSEFLLLRSFGMRLKKILLTNGLVALLIFVGIYIGQAVGSSSVSPLVLGGAGGYLLHIVFFDSGVTHKKTNLSYLKSSIFFGIGAGIAFLFSMLVSH